MKTCRTCKTRFEGGRPFQPWCSPECGTVQALEKLAKAKAKRAACDRRETKARLEVLKTRSQHLQDTQRAFNSWIRARDAGKGCISCGTHNGKENAGHYLSVGSRPELRFHPDNCHLQCERCNTYLHGNLIDYRQALIGRIGMARVHWLEGPHEPAKWTVDELKAMTKRFRADVRNIEGGNRV